MRKHAGVVTGAAMAGVGAGVALAARGLEQLADEQEQAAPEVRHVTLVRR